MSLVQHEESMFRGLLQAAPDGILACDRAGNITLVNEQLQQMLGYSSAELLGQKVELLLPPAARSSHESLREDYLSNPRRRPMGIGLDLFATHKNGSTLPVEICLSSFELDGQLCAIAIIRDVTEIRRMSRELKDNNLQLKRSNEDLEQFAYVASHDLQEPLRAVTGYTQLLQRRCATKLDLEANEYIALAVDGAKNMQVLINDLLTYSRVSTRSQIYAPVDLNDVAKQALHNLEVAIAEAKAVIIVEALPLLPGDQVQLTQLLQNLIGNALKFRSEHRQPKVHISAQRAGSDWNISIADNGIGIDAAYADRIFVIFQRLNSRDRYPGTGIGLAICKRVVERHSGKIWFESTPGQSTTFHVTLPAEHGS